MQNSFLKSVSKNYKIFANVLMIVRI